MTASSELGKISALILANYILKYYGPMSHLKLQKLLYYTEAYHLAYFECPVLNEEFEAWVHGPVCKPVYSSLKDSSILHTEMIFDSSKDADPDKDVKSILTSSQIENIDFFLKQLSSWTGLELEAATHREFPWIEARMGIPASRPCSNLIKKNTMKEFYFAEIRAGA